MIPYKSSAEAINVPLTVTVVVLTGFVSFLTALGAAEGEGVAAETLEVAVTVEVAVGRGVPTLLGSCEGAALTVRSLP